MLTQPVSSHGRKPNCHLLVVDDDIDLLETLPDTLSINSNFTIKTTTPANSAMLIASSFKPEIARPDLRPGHDNDIESGKKLNPLHPQAAGIMTTAHRSIGYSIFQAGWRQYLFTI